MRGHEMEFRGVASRAYQVVLSLCGPVVIPGISVENCQSPAANVIDVIESERPVAAARSLRLDPYCSLRPRFLGLPDANAVLSSVDNDCRNGWRSRLLRMTEGGTAALYAPSHVYWEIYRRLPRLASFSPVPLADLRRHFEDEYLPLMRFVQLSDGDVADPQVLAISDPDDVPLGQLAKLIARASSSPRISLCAGQGSPRRTGD